MLRSMALALLATAWLGGIGASGLVGSAAWPLVAACAAAMLALALQRRDRLVVVYAILLPALVAGGIVLEGQARTAASRDGIGQFRDGVAMRFRGTIRDDAERRDTSQRFIIDMADVQIGGGWQRTSGAAVVTAPLLPEYRAGDVIEMEGQYESPPERDGFDYGGYLALRGIGGVIGYPEIRVVRHDDPQTWRAAISAVRRRLAHGLDLALPEPESSLARGVLLGQRSALPDDVNDDLNVSNTSHLVVVSGSNVVYVSAFCTMLFSFVAGKRRALLLSLAGIVGYCLLAGASPPVMRAMIMGFVLVFARVSGRRTDGVTSLLVAAALMAALDPLVLRDVSFQLSFAATAGIMTLAAPLDRATVVLTGRLLRRDEMPRWFGALVANPLSMTVASWIITAPMLVYYFGRLSLVALPANMLVVPAFPFILAFSLLAAVGGMLPFGHVAFGAPAYFALSYWLAVAHGMASLPGAAVEMDIGVKLTVALYGVLVVALGAALAKAPRIEGASLRPSRPFTWRGAGAPVAAGVAFVALAGSAFVVWPSGPRRLEVTVLDVGQGDAILVETPSGRNVLIDGGPGSAVLRGLGEELSWRDRRIDLVVLTHPQADHMMGLLDVLDRYDVARVVAGPGADRVPSAFERAWSDAVADEGSVAEPARAGAAFDLGDGVMLEVLAPTDEMTRDPEANNRGVVLRLSWGDVSFLLTADIEARAEEALIASGADLRASVLKVAHHGSATSSTQEFLDAVWPSVSAISAGDGNRYGHPADEVVARLDAYGLVLLTATDGAVHFETDGRRLWVD